MATKPIAAVASVGLPPGTTKNDIRQLHNGLVEVGDRYNCKLIGGDITSWKNDGKLVVNICAISEPVGKPVKRDGAKPDDIICVTGRLGGSIKGKHMNFDPRVDEAIKIASLVKLNSMMDISDGLSCDLPRICQQSNVGAIINASDIPISPAASHSDRDPLNAALNDGEDFELLFTLSPTQWSKLKQSWNDKLPITPIGQIDQKPGVRINFGQGKIEKLKPAGYDHLENER
jgi:thiamine-monophosphate kinase